MNLDALKSLDPKDIANWPPIPKGAALFALLALILLAGYWFDWSNQLNNLDASKQKEVELRDTFLGKIAEVDGVWLRIPDGVVLIHDRQQKRPAGMFQQLYTVEVIRFYEPVTLTITVTRL